jgi:Fe-S-cluster-containing hydrogenase component 2
MKRIKVKAEICAGCRQCEMVCSFEHFKRFSPSLSRVTVQKDDRNGLDYPVTCRQCSDCPPIDACPVQALSRTEEGLTWCDADTCIGCGVCEKECKYDAIKVSEGMALVCDLCGIDPQCVARCPTGALEYVEMSEFTETPKEAFARLKEEWGFE